MCVCVCFLSCLFTYLFGLSCLFGWLVSFGLFLSSSLLLLLFLHAN